MSRALKGAIGLLVAVAVLSGMLPATASPKSKAAVLQIRRVLGTVPSCSGWKSEPPGGKPALIRVLGQPKQCYRVGISDASLQGVDAVAANEAANGQGWVINVPLSHAQSVAFNKMAVRDFHKVVTCVVEGMALNEVNINTRDFGGSFQIWSPYFTKQSAQRIARELDAG